ncbi:MAG: hypothetical protein MJ213_00960 [Bacilli bacterium]|nr:hypothetical protein [Bacilli bacterium]
MKKIKLIVPVVSCLLVTALFSCANNNEQPESNYYSISIANAHKSPKVSIEGSNLIKKGDACDVLIRFEPFTYLATIPDYPSEVIRICQANRIGYDIALDKSCYTFEEAGTGDPCLYRLHINKEYMVTSYVVDINSEFVEAYTGENDIKFSSGSSLNDDNAEIIVVNTSVDSDLTFFITPKNFQSGYTFDGDTKDAIKIIGVSDDEGEVDLTSFVTRKELVICDSPIQGLSHYQTSEKQLRIALPMDKLFVTDDDPETFYGYKQRFTSIEIKSDKGVVYNKEKSYENIFSPTADETSCTFTSGKIELRENSVHYVAKFAPQDDYRFPSSFTEENFPITDLTILPKVYLPTGHPYFRTFEIHSDTSKQGAIKTSPYKSYIGGNETLSILSSVRVLEDTAGNIYVPMGYDNDSILSGDNYWLDVDVKSGNLVVDVNITDMVKYVEFPTSTIIARTDLIEYGDEFYKFYRDGSIDFIQSFNFTVKAVHN